MWFQRASVTSDCPKDSGGGCPITLSSSIMMQNEESKIVNKKATKSMLGLDSSRPDGAQGGS